MPSNEKCPICGNPTINGICLDCGASPDNTAFQPEEEERDSRYTDRFDAETESLDDIAAPSFTSMSGDEVISSEEALKMAKKAEQPADRKQEPSNPYANVIPYERPDYGDNYIAPKTVIRSDGVPQASNSADDDMHFISQDVNLHKDKTWLSYWWLILIFLILPYQISYFHYATLAVGAALQKFDEKGGRQAGVILIVIAVLKFILMGIAAM